MFFEAEDIRSHIHDALTRRRTEEQAYSRVRLRAWTWIAVALWAAVLVLFCLSLPRMFLLFRQLYFE